MINGICVYAENSFDKIDPIFKELLSAAKDIKSVTGEDIIVISYNLDEDEKKYLSRFDVDKVYNIKSKESMLLKDDVLSKYIARLVKEIEPSTILVPATTHGKSVFSRVAVRLNCGMTADCTQIGVNKVDDNFSLDQIKPSFGSNIMVTIVNKDGVFPRILTLRQGVYKPEEEGEVCSEVIDFELENIESKIKVLSIEDAVVDTDSIMSAETVVVVGKAVLEGDNYQLIERFAEKVGAAIGGTRPIADAGIIPFDHQIGQTGFTIRPKVCISVGASGAIQHTEGIKDTDLMIAINTDETAPILNISDYALLGDLEEIIKAFMGE